MRSAGVIVFLFIATFCGAQAAYHDTDYYAVQPADFNSVNAEYGPYVAGGAVWFLSTRRDRPAVVYSDRSGSTALTDIYAKDISSTNVKRVRELSGPGHEGPLCFSADGRTMYFTGTDPRSGKLVIYKRTRAGKRWKKPSALAFCSGGNFCHPALAGDSILYFAASYAGDSQMDLYRCRIGTNAVERLGAKINTAANEVFPFVLGDWLYFASDRQGGLGGLDLYRASLSSGKAEMLPPPMNSAADDFSFWADSSGGYFASARSGRDDIYRFVPLFPAFADAVDPVPPPRCYVFFDANAAQLKDSSHYTYRWQFGDGTGARGCKVRHCYTSGGTRKVSMSVYDTGGRVIASQSYALAVPEVTPPCIAVDDSLACGQAAHFEILGDSGAQAVWWSFGDGRISSELSPRHSYQQKGAFEVEAYYRLNGKATRLSRTVVVSR